jgi:molybdopterin-guanine dinucleotide biosynthesis protein A
MGRDKAMLPFGPGEVMLQRVVRLTAEVVPARRIVCVAGPDQQIPSLPPHVVVIHDRQAYRGPLAGLAGGVAAIFKRADVVFVTGCDMPLLVPALIERLFEVLGDHEIAVPDDGRRRHPLAAVYRVDVLAVAEALLANGQRSLQALLDACRTRWVPVDELREVDPQLGSLSNCNTLEDYRRALGPGGPSL